MYIHNLSGTKHTHALHNKSKSEQKWAKTRFYWLIWCIESVWFLNLLNHLKRFFLLLLQMVIKWIEFYAYIQKMENITRCMCSSFSFGLNEINTIWYEYYSKSGRLEHTVYVNVLAITTFLTIDMEILAMMALHDMRHE